MIRILVWRGEGPVAVYVFETDSVVIGRGGGAPAVDLRLPFADVSRAQCQVRARGDQVSVAELSGSGGTYLEASGARIRGEVRVGPEEVLRFGGCSMRVSREPGDMPARAAGRARGRAPELVKVSAEAASGPAPEIVQVQAESVAARAPQVGAGARVMGVGAELDEVRVHEGPGALGIARGAAAAVAQGLGRRALALAVGALPLWLGVVGVGAGLFAGGIDAPWIVERGAVAVDPGRMDEGERRAEEPARGAERGGLGVVGVIGEIQGIDAVGGGESALVSAAGGRWILDGERGTLRKLEGIGEITGPWAAAPGWLVEVAGRGDSAELWGWSLERGATRVGELRGEAVIHAVRISPGGQRVAMVGEGWIEVWQGPARGPEKEGCGRACNERLARARIEGVGGGSRVTVGDEGTAVALVGRDAWVLRGDGGAAQRLGAQVTAGVVLKDGRVVLGDRLGALQLWSYRGRRWRSERVGGPGPTIVGLIEGPGREELVVLDAEGGIDRVELGARWRREGEALRVRLGTMGGEAQAWSLARGGWLGLIDRQGALWAVDAGRRSGGGAAERMGERCGVVAGAGEGLWCGRLDGGIIRVELGGRGSR